MKNSSNVCSKQGAAIATLNFLPQMTASLLVQNCKVHRALAQMKTSVASWAQRYPPRLLAIDVNILGKQGTAVPIVCAPCWETSQTL